MHRAVSALALLFSIAACGSDDVVSDANSPPGDAPKTPGDPSPSPSTPGESNGDPEWSPPILPTSSVACGVAHGQDVGVTHATAAGRTFHVWAPDGYDGMRTYPVVLMFHGWQTDGASFQSWFEMDKYVDGEAIVVYPDAAGGFWDLSGPSDLVFFDDMLKMLGETYCIDPSHVLAFGFSYGGKFVNHLGCKRAGYARAIAIGDGSDGGDYTGCGRLPVLFTHRTVDTDERIEWARAAAERWTQVLGCSEETDSSNAELNCVQHRGCRTPGSLSFCEDTFYDASWPADWNHTVREPYRSYTWHWFQSQP